MKSTHDVVFLSAQKQPYTIDGRSGVAYPVRVLTAGTLYKLRGTEELYEVLRDIPEMTKGKAEIEITSAKENTVVHLRSFTPAK